jgi:hypothetical protein
LAMEKQTKALSLTGWTWWRSHGRRGALVHAQSLAEKTFSRTAVEYGVVSVMRQKFRNKAWDVRTEEIGSLEKIRGKKMDCAHRNRPGKLPVPRTCELKFEQPGGYRSVWFEGKWRGENGA